MIDLSEKKDEELILYILDDPENYSEIMTRYREKLERYINRIANLSNDDVVDLVQDVFLAVYENINSFNPKMSFSSWIYRIAHNKTINFWKKRKGEAGQISVEDNIFLVEMMFSENSVERDILDIENSELVRGIFEKMDYKYRTVLMLKFLEEKDYKEISDILQKPMGSVATLINRAKKNFQKEYVKKMANFE